VAPSILIRFSSYGHVVAVPTVSKLTLPHDVATVMVCNVPPPVSMLPVAFTAILVLVTVPSVVGLPSIVTVEPIRFVPVIVKAPPAQKFAVDEMPVTVGVPLTVTIRFVLQLVPLLACTVKTMLFAPVVAYDVAD
jgi:hypothetical protein